MRILVTGASGFVGRHLVPALGADHDVVIATRRTGRAPESVREVLVGDIDGSTDWSTAMDGVDVVLHLAARVHVMKETSEDALEAYRRVNTRGTRKLADAAAAAGVRRFVFLSSIKVNGEATHGTPITATDTPAPVDPYGVSKWEAEQGLRSVAAGASMDVVILRPPVIYGHGVGGNVARIARAVRAGLPLPLGRIHNQRTMLNVSNLAVWVRAAIGHETAPAVPVLVGDPTPVSSSDLVRYIAEGMGRKARLLGVPVEVLSALGTVAGRAQDVHRLVDDLEILPTWDALGVSADRLLYPADGLRELGRTLVAGADS